MDENHAHPEFHSVLEGIDVAPQAPPRRRWTAVVRERVMGVLRADARLSRKSGMAVGASLALMGVIGGAALAWDAWRPVRAPDVERDPLDGVLDFALLNEDFSRLPVEERLALALGLVKRMRSMSGSDSALVAAFAAGISGKARETLEANVRTLGMDLMASYAEKYAKTPEADREKFIESAAVEWAKIGEQLGGEARDISDEQRLAEMKEQAQQDAERSKRNDRGLQARNVSNLFRMVQNDINKYSSPNERAGTQRFLRDMTRTLRGRDPATNQPKKG